MKDAKPRHKVIQALMSRHETEPAHVKQVQKLALELFDALPDLHGLGPVEREWLSMAALLHDVGWSRGGNSHHKSSLKIILQANLPGWHEEEILVIANIARYHRKSEPKQSHKYFALLAPARQEAVNKLAALLRLADGLDRAHDSGIRGLTCVRQGLRIALIIKAMHSIPVAKYGFEKKRDFFQAVYGLEIYIKHVELEA